MWGIIRKETIATARTGVPVQLDRLCRDIAAGTEVPLAAVPGDADAAVDEDLLGRLLLDQLRTAGLFAGDDGPSTDEAIAGLPVGDELRRWAAESVRQLRIRGHLQAEPATLRPGGADSGRDPWAEWAERSARWAADADLRAQVVLLDTTLRALPRILTGAVPATDVLFPRSSLELVEGIYKGNAVTDLFNGVLADTAAAVARAIVGSDPGARIRILEIGAGTGGGSQKVFQRLEPLASHVETYCYTDLSRSFLMHAEQEYGPKYPYLDYRLLDVEKPLAAQGVEFGSFDLVLATNVLHATRDIRRTLRNAKAALKENGVLLANEISANSLFTHLTFGLLTGWWLYEDAELRIPGCPGLSPESWAEVLEDEGFDAVSFPAEGLHGMGYQIVAAQSDGVIRQETEQTAAARRDERSPQAVAAERPARRAPVTGAGPGHGAAVPDGALEQHVSDIVFDQLAQALKVDRARIDADDAFMDYGVDSIIGVRLIHEINERLGVDLATTDLFDHPSVRQLTAYVLDEHRERAAASLPLAPTAVAAGPEQPPAEPAPPDTDPLGADSVRTAPDDAVPAGAARPSAPGREPIAIVGMSGRYGGSPGVDELWEHLVRGDNLVEEVTRWHLSDPPPGAPGCRHGSFVDDHDRFDPAFFNLSGVEATYMDPQQRVFLEEAWKALEDAGYAGNAARGKRCGVYVGCQESGYTALFGDEAPAPAMWGNALSALPARISYHLDLQGPAVAVDTACSSSLVAIHLACQGLWGGETEMALAGGVSIQCTPQFYLLAGRAGMLSPTGRCHTFDDRADGFVPGEGAGVVVLKRLADALVDGDHIHGVISGSGINQDGASNGITAPSAKSQERLETSVYDAFGIDPDGIQLVEAHGTGTKLGDPIEYHALKRAFGRYTDRREFCALGSVKSNLGHTTTAAGVAGVIKILLSLRHRRIPPSINFEVGNSHIDFTDSPFYVNTEDRPWEPGADGKRRAAVSSFGVSGTNAHMVIEEAPQRARHASAHPAHLVTLSADSAEQLREQAERLAAHCAANPGLDPGGVSFTLLLGRRHLTHRLACVARDQDDVVSALRQWLATGSSPQVHVGGPAERGQGERASLKSYGNDCVRRSVSATDAGARTELLSTVADLYAQGYDLDYAGLFAERRPVRVPLPTYPFARDRYWVPEAPRPAAGPAPSAPHPLLHVNASTLRAQRYETTFTGGEYFLTDHVVKGQKVLPGVACLEMARAAAELAEPNRDPAGLTLRNVVWARPVTVGGSPVTLATALTPGSRDEIDFAITGADGAVHSQGQVVHGPGSTPSVLDVERIRAACDRAELDAGQLYPLYERIGFEYGPAHRGVERLHIGHDEVLVRLAQPGSVRDTLDAFVLHPSLLDSTLQGSLGMGAASAPETALEVAGMKPSLPFALDELEILGPCTEDMWAWIRYSPGTAKDGKVFKLDIDLCDERGSVRARVKGISYRVLDEQPGDTCVTFLPVWERTVRAAAEAWPARHVVLLCDMPELADAFAARHPSADVLRLTSAVPGTAERFTEYAVAALEHVRQIMPGSARQDVLVQLVVPEDGDRALALGLLGLLKSARAEDPALRVRAVLVDAGDSAEHLVTQVTEAARRAEGDCVRFRGGGAEVLTWAEHTAPAERRVPWKNGGVYLVTGGLGGIGTLVAADMAAEVGDVTVVLAGRSPLGLEQEALIARWRGQGADVRHARVDVGDAAAVRALVDGIVRDHGALHGVVHGAGVVRDNFLGRKTPQECREVLAPKVAGVVNLDEATKDLPLDFFVTFAAAAGVFGNTGQADYAAANAFLDAYAHHRRGLVEQGLRSGASVSVDWPLWADGGMRVDERTESVMLERLGMAPMRAETGIQALYAALDAAHTQVLVIAGDATRIRRTVLREEPRPGRSPALPAADRPRAATDRAATDRAATDRAATGTGAAHAKVVGHLRTVISEAVQVPAHRLDPAAPFERYGIDSVLALTITDRLEADFGSLSKTLLFEHQCVDDLARYFLGTHADALEPVLGIGAAAEHPVAAPPARSHAAPEPSVRAAETSVRQAELPLRPAEPHGPREEEAIAVVGLAGRYPGAADLDELWENLVTARDCVTQVPADRWDHEQVTGEPGEALPWGGFLDSVADFDALLFNVAPSEAAIMDPQTRMFLECVWTLLENSGYTRERLRARHGGRVGVYVGTMYQQYQLLPSDAVHESITSVVSAGAVANRVSHFFDLRGPSMAVDTTCSSSLVAIHMACEELRRGGSELMVVGGVNLSLHSKKYRGLRMTGLMGSSPDSRAFLDGDGFVPAEGVGAVLLKPLSRAVSDGDEVLAVIRSSAVNHKGRTNGPMVPSVEQQEELVEENLRRAGVHPRTVSYVEASANGSQLGDAIEFAALRNVFGRYTPDEGFCALGTVKSTIGNLEAASGVAQLSKVALQMRHGRITPPLLRGGLNPGLRLDGTAFYLPEQATRWDRPVAEIDGVRREYPRRATISAFGAGGSNAHLVVEEYLPAADGREPAAAAREPRVVVLSARTADRLRAHARRVLDFVRTQAEVSVTDLAYTLQRGREAMEHRLALVAEDVKQLVGALEHFLGDEAADTAPVPLFTGDTRRDGADIGALLTGSAGEALVQQLLAENRPQDVALFWARGGAVPWDRVQGAGRLLPALPTYPFDRQRHWLNPGPAADGTATAAPRPEAREPVGGADTPRSAPRPAPDGIPAVVAGLLGLPMADLDLDTPLEDLGFSSVLATQLLQRIQRFAPEAGLRELADCRTTRDLVRRFGAATRPDPAAPGEASGELTATEPAELPEVVHLNGSSRGRPVFWFHGGLGGVEAYGAVADSIERPFYGIQAKGWMTDSEPLTGILAMAAHYAAIIRAVQPEGPYDLGGYSLGGMLAYEVARQLQEAGRAVETITMLDTMYADEVKARTMSRKDMVLQQVNALLQAGARPTGPDAPPAFIAGYEVDLSRDADELLDELLPLARQRGLVGGTAAVRERIEQNIRVLEAYRVLEYEVAPLPRPDSVTCFYFRNGSGLFYGDLEPVLSTQDDGKALDHVVYWGEWERRIPDFHRTDVDSSNHFVMLSDEASLSVIRAFCKVFYSSGREKTRITNAKKWVGRRAKRPAPDAVNTHAHRHGGKK
ncbi:SDR family NAD(P)-dependent oxidoreductase [Streptomyces sp. NEAU-W12]|uniref:SDR family NAD(P)-dependent oxidoreductase n=1 Tax=Streptomyces sp. NEAU-W12 TaxID=2994668 RepID=UPI00224B212F|nr:SDR family NAD(P)-dependent oxidoreductase [Streptomyces sp. NEAU-W12]MCX2924136.1 SDR family NAD(P)-dependent oxidoreductase [Streptomyces sp. NEAU-W12]